MPSFFTSLRRRLFGTTKRQGSRLIALVGALDGPVAENDPELFNEKCLELSGFLDELAAEEDHPDVTKLRGAGYFDLGAAFRNMLMKEKAEEAFAEAIRILEGLRDVKKYAHYAASQLAGCRNQLGLLYMELGPPEKAAAALEDAISRRREIMRKYPADAENQVYLGGALCNRGHLSREQEEKDKALAFYQESIEILDKALPPCDCGCRDSIAMAVSQASGFPHWIVLAQQFRQNAEGGMALLVEKQDSEISAD